jgi:hypothetical protein
MFGSLVACDARFLLVFVCLTRCSLYFVGAVGESPVLPDAFSLASLPSCSPLALPPSLAPSPLPHSSVRIPFTTSALHNGIHGLEPWGSFFPSRAVDHGNRCRAYVPFLFSFIQSMDRSIVVGQRFVRSFVRSVPYPPHPLCIAFALHPLVVRVRCPGSFALCPVSPFMNSLSPCPSPPLRCGGRGSFCFIFGLVWFCFVFLCICCPIGRV